MPKAKPFPDNDEEEKTTIESQWEDEASTTVEQGEVADKIRALQQPRTGTNVTSTGAGQLDEPTVDDQHAQLSAITPLRDVARLVITAGNDIAQEHEVRPGKTYTIGRAIDNDVVLTDISVSRKHFDLRFEDGAWVIVDRGSGNGTVVNGNLEDNPFMLANGDVIEIGNTVFRFDQPNAAARPQRTLDIEQDDEEMSTVAGKPLRPEIVEVLDEIPQAPRPARPKTLPPPTPLRQNNASQPPPLGYPPPGPPQPLTPASTIPMPQMANRPPLGNPMPMGNPMGNPMGMGNPMPMGNPMAPTMLGDSMGMPNPLPTTMPGQAPPPRQPYGYPQATEIPPHSVHAQMLLIQTQNRRGDGSTALVPPVPYDSLQVPQVRYSNPQLTRKTKLVLGGIGLAVFAAVMTVAIVKSGSGKAKAVAGEKTKVDKKNDPKAAAKMTAKTTATPIEAAKAPAPTNTPPAPAPTNTAPTPANAAPIAAKTAPAPAPAPTPTTTVAKTVTPPAPAPAPAPPPTTTVAKTVTAPAPAPAPAPIVAKKEPPKKEPPKKEPPKRERREARREPAREAPRETEPAPAPAPKRVGVAGDPDAAKDKAEALYRARKFAEASTVLKNAAGTIDDEDEAKQLRRTSEMYANLGRSLAQGTAPATKATEAFEALRKAANFDRNLGNAFDSEIQTKLGQVAPKAALSYMAAKNYPSARTAADAASQFGASESVKIVRQKLETVASELYNEGMKELSSNPASAKDKFRQIKNIVDAKSPWHVKAQKQLNGG